MLYNPDLDFINRLELLKGNGYTIYIFDNTPEFTKRDDRLKKVYDVNYFTCGVNLGLGIGITTICFNAYNANFEALLFFDQDTKFTNETLNYVTAFIEYIKDDFNSFGAIQFSNKVNTEYNNSNNFSLRLIYNYIV